MSVIDSQLTSWVQVIYLSEIILFVTSLIKCHLLLILFRSLFTFSHSLAWINSLFFGAWIPFPSVWPKYLTQIYLIFSSIGVTPIYKWTSSLLVFTLIYHFSFQLQLHSFCEHVMARLDWGNIMHVFSTCMVIAWWVA